MLLKVVKTDMKKRIAVYAALCILFIFFSSCRRNTKIEYIEDPSWSKVQVKAALVIGISDFVPILSFRNEKNEIVGYDIDIFTAVNISISYPTISFFSFLKERMGTKSEMPMTNAAFT